MLPISPDRIAKAMAVLQQARARLTPYLSAEDDDKLWQDSIEGVVPQDPYQLFDRLVETVLEAEAMVALVKDRINQLATRQARFEARADWARTVTADMLEALSFRRLERPQYTLSISPGRAGVRITELNLVPEGLVKVERRPLLAQIGDRLRQGDQVPGAELSNPRPYLTIRRT